MQVAAQPRPGVKDFDNGAVVAPLRRADRSCGVTSIAHVTFAGNSVLNLPPNASWRNASDGYKRKILGQNEQTLHTTRTVHVAAFARTFM